MNKALLITLGAFLRRFGALAGTALLAFLAEHWVGWLDGALQGNSGTAKWLPLIYLGIEFVQKLWRERNKAKGVTY